ncbi:ran-binding protein, partial [Reticulomyxa filosa]
MLFRLFYVDFVLGSNNKKFLKKRCSVLFDNVKKPVTIETKKILPKSEITPIGCVPITAELLSYFTVFTQPLHFDTRDLRKKEKETLEEKVALEKPKEDNKPVEEAAAATKAPLEKPVEPPALTWECPTCTLVNLAELTNCDACSTPNPNAQEMLALNNQILQGSGFGASFSDEPTTVKNGNSPSEQSKNEKVTEIPDMVSEPSLEQLLFHQLRSFGLKALCCLLQQPEAIKLMLEERQGGNLSKGKLLPDLLSIATRPMDLDQYRSVEFLEDQEDRLSEMLHDKPLKMSERIPKSATQLTQRQLLKYSPFRMLQVHLPSRLDTESARGIIFSRSHEFRIMFKKEQHHIIGYCRTNNMIPLSIPGYYFEVKILKLGDTSSKDNNNNNNNNDASATDPKHAEKNWKVAIGLWRAGMNFQGDCGDESSYAFGATGYVYSTISRKRVAAKLSEGFVEGDVIGLCWDQHHKAIFFTRNGTIVGSRSSFDGVNGQFYPMVWLQGNGAQVAVNLGQEEMSFNIESSLDQYQIEQLKNEKQVYYSEAEIQRRTMAEELVRMMGDIFPLEFAVVTLEQCNDDLAMAADYLVNNASRELDRIAQNMSVSTAPADPLQPEDIKDDNKDIEDDNNGHMGLMNFIADNLEDDNSGRAGARDAAAGGDNLLDDEVDARLPVGLTMEEISANADVRYAEEVDNAPRRGGAAGAGAGAGGAANNEEEDANRRQIGIGNRLLQQLPPIQIQKIRAGQYLSVWNDAHRICHEFWPKYWKRLQGKTGIVHSVDVNKNPVEELNIRTDEVIEQIQEGGLQPTDIKKDVPVFGVGSYYVEIEHALSIRKVRRSLLWLLQHWPEGMAFDLDMFGGVDTVIRLLDLAAAEALSAGTSKSKLLVKRKNSLIKDFGKVFALLQEEQKKQQKEPDVLAMRFSPDIFHKKWRKADIKPTRKDLILIDQPCKTLTQGLVEECILHFVQAVNDPNEMLMFESPHKPYPGDVDERRVVYVPGASRLMVTFDSQCKLANDFKTGLTFYADQDFEDQYVRCRGSGRDRFPTFIVPSNRFWFKFTSSYDNKHWGYRFYVKPIEKHIDDHQALDAFNFELGCWLFELLMEHQHILEQSKYVVPFGESLLHFVVHLESNAKTRGIEQLIKFLLCVHKLPPDRRPVLNLKKLEELREKMDDVVDKIIRRDQPEFLNSLVELMAIAELKGKEKEKEREREKINEKHAKASASTNANTVTYDQNELYVWKIYIISAVWGVFSEQRIRDITHKMQEH